MVTHVVMWNLKDTETQQEAGQEMKHKLEALVGQVPGLLEARVHLGFAGYDVCLVSRLESREALEVYQNHPAHLLVKEYVHSVISARASCDFDD